MKTNNSTRNVELPESVKAMIKENMLPTPSDYVEMFEYYARVGYVPKEQETEITKQARHKADTMWKSAMECANGIPRRKSLEERVADFAFANGWTLNADAMKFYTMLPSQLAR
jgi:hypothetical protein